MNSKLFAIKSLAKIYLILNFLYIKLIAPGSSGFNWYLRVRVNGTGSVETIFRQGKIIFYNFIVHIVYAPSLTTDLRYNTPGQDYSRRVIFLGEKYFQRFDDVGSSKKRRKERKRERRKKKKKKKGGGGGRGRKNFSTKNRARPKRAGFRFEWNWLVQRRNTEAGTFN